MEFGQICGLLAERCKTPPGAELCASLAPASVPALAEKLLDETSEMIGLSASGLVLFPNRTSGPEAIIAVVRKGLLPEKEEIADFISFLSQAVRIGGFIASRPSAPRLMELCKNFRPLDEVISFFSSVFSSDGTIRPDSSALLMDLESRIGAIRQRIHAKADRMLAKKEFADKLQDSYVTVRNDRVVFPVKAEYKNVFPGIIHGISASDKTAFIEPQELVADNNLLREAFAERDAEIYRLMREASMLVTSNEEAVRADYSIAGQLDMVCARSWFSTEISGSRPQLTEKGPVSLFAVRHPMMAVRGENPVPNDVAMGEGERTLVISGPNAGGKTVLLKSVGLCVLLSACGIFPPVRQGSTFPFAKKMYAMVGDEQSISEGESTFTAQLGGIKEALDGGSEGTWVIVDEILNGTDPAQAGVLAETVLEYLAKKGCLTFVSTHLPGLKVAAQENSDMVNAAMGSGADSAFKLVKGMPGVSNPLGVASAMGIPEEILASARERLTDTRDRYQSALTELSGKSAELERRLGELGGLEEKARQTAENLSARLMEAEAARDEFEREKRKKLKVEIARVREEVSQLVQTARDGDLKAKKEAEQKLKKMERDIIEQIHRPDSVPLETLGEGDFVWITALDRKAKLLRLSGSRAEVLCGESRMTVDVKDIIGIKEKEKADAKKKSSRGGLVFDAEEKDAAEINLMGMTGEDALLELDKFLDTQYLRGADRVKVIHGRSVLRGKVTGYFKTSAYVKSFSQGSMAEGGDAVSLVELKEG